MRVVHIYKDYDPPVHGGIEKHIATLGRFLSRLDVEVEVLCARPPGAASDEMDDAVKLHRCRSLATVASTPLPPALPWRLWRNAADVIHLHYPWPPGEAAWWLGSRGRPLVVSFHCEPVRYPRLAKLVGPLTEHAFAKARAILVTDDALRSPPSLQAHQDRLEIVPFGIDLERFIPVRNQDDPLPGVARPRVVFVGRLRHYKGLPILTAALAGLPGAQLIVVGDGPERSSFETDLGAAGVRDRVHFLGNLDEARLIAILRDADAAVMPSTSAAEAFGLAIVEAQACGTPAVTTEVGTATAATVDDGRSGRVVAPSDADALAEGIRWCLAPAQLEERRAAARAHAAAHFDAERMAKQVAAIYAAHVG